MQKKKIWGTLGLLFLGAVFGAILVSNFGYVRPSYGEVQLGSKNEPVQQIDGNLQSFQDAFIEVARKVTPSIVEIKVVSKIKEDPHKGLQFFMPFDQMPKEQEGLGSGVIISDDGYIVTNNHVVKNATSVTVTLSDKRNFDAEVIGTDPLTDLAVIKIDAKGLTPVHFGDSDKLKVGQWVMAIGNPLSFSSTVTAGIVSAKNRSLRLIKNSYGVENFIQTDAVINPGNSGGALVDLHGSLVGINSAIATNGFSASYIGYGFAIPVNLVKSVANDLIENGEVSRGYIGVRIEAVTDATARAVGLDKPEGVLIQDIVKDGAASKKDIKAGDIILEIDGRAVNQPNTLQNYIAQKRAGDTVKLLIFRDGEKIERYVTLKAPDGKTERHVRKKKSKKENNNFDVVKFDNIGLQVRNMHDSEYNDFNVDNGVLIVNVERFSKAEEAGLGRGLVILEVDRKKIDDVSQLKDILDDKEGSAVLLQVIYPDGNKRFVGLEIPKK